MKRRIGMAGIFKALADIGDERLAAMSREGSGTERAIAAKLLAIPAAQRGDTAAWGPALDELAPLPSGRQSQAGRPPTAAAAPVRAMSFSEWVAAGRPGADEYKAEQERRRAEHEAFRRKFGAAPAAV